MRALNVEDDIADLQIRDLGAAKSAATCQSEDDQVAMGVQRAFGLCVGENSGEFAARDTGDGDP